MAGKKNPEERAKKTNRSSGTAKAVVAGGAAVGAGAAAKYAKKAPVAVVVGIVCLVIGVLVGYFAASATTSFSVRGEDLGTVNMHETYTDAGAELRILGRDRSEEIKTNYLYREDISHDATSCDGINTEVAGFYYVVYTCDSFPYRNVQLIRTIEVTRVEDDGE